jgi:lipoate-protein ligase B
VLSNQKSWNEVIFMANLGRSTYVDALRRQHTVHTYCVRTGRNALLLTEHEPVITLGYRRLHEQILAPSAFLAERGLTVVETDRGGGATYHGPGQLVAYPIFSSLLRRCGVRRMVANLEEILCRVSRAFGVGAERRNGSPGAWVGTRKIGSVGIAVRGGVSLHGCALNVILDLQPFSYIIPCGLMDAIVKNLAQETAMSISMSAVESILCM